VENTENADETCYDIKTMDGGIAMNTSFTRTIKHFFVLVALFVAVAINSSQVISSQTINNLSTPTAIKNTGVAYPPTPETTVCYPDSGWKWTIGPSEPEIALQVEQELNHMGIEAFVIANSYGETDSCGTFKLSGIDFNIAVKRTSTEQINGMFQQQVADEIYPMLVKLGKPNLGNVKITFPQGNTITLNDKILTKQLAALTLGTGWQQVTTTVSPQGRYLYGLAYDSQRQMTVLLGGDSTGSVRLNDTWEYDGINWHQATPSQSPPGRVNIDQTLVYDSNRQRIILFGGLGSSGYLSDTWEYDSTTWSQINTDASPQKRDAHAMVFDSYRSVTVLFGGYNSSGSRLNDTWEYNGAWQQVNTAQTPPGRFHHSMAYDAQRHVTVLFGGVDSANTKLGDTWEYDGTTWRQITPSQSPPARDNHSLAYDSARGVIVLFGGAGSSGLLNDTWEYDGTTWQQIPLSQSPSARTEMSMVYDSQRNKVVFFGGGYWNSGKLTVFNDTWEYTGTSTPVAPGVLDKKVYVIVYDPILNSGQKLSAYLHWNDHTILTQGTIDLFKQASNNKMNYTVVETTIVTDGWPETTDGFRYTEAQYLAVLNGQIPPPTTSMVSYNKIVNSPTFDICGKANRGEIDEVWIYNGPYFGFYESTLVGPGAYWYNSPPVPGPYTCNRLIPIMGPSPERGLDCAVENFGHRTESTMVQVYGSWQQNRTSHNWEKFALVKALSPNYSYSGCGNIHYPPNGTSDYDYSNSATVMSNCSDFVNYPNLSDPLTVLQPVTCSAWNCSHVDYFRYWFSHFPSNAGCGPDNVANNWWRYFAEPARASDPHSACEPLAPALAINFATGQPGSFFTITGNNFPPDSTATIKINGVSITTTVTTDALGNLTFILDTSDASVGSYRVTVTVNPSVVITFELDVAQPLRPQVGSGTVIVVPSDIGYKESVFLPIVQK